MRVEYHPDATEEFVDAMLRYEDEEPGLGDTFRARIDAAVSAVIAMPFAAPHWPGQTSVRRVLIRQFPYALVYSVHAHSVFIIAVAHRRRQPGYWQYRLMYH